MSVENTEAPVQTFNFAGYSQVSQQAGTTFTIQLIREISPIICRISKIGKSICKFKFSNLFPKYLFEECLIS